MKQFNLLILKILIVFSFLGFGFLDSIDYRMGDLATSNLTKIFPGSYLLIILLLIRFINYPTKIFNVFFGNISLSGYLLFMIMVILYLYSLNYASSVSFILDTLIIPFLFFIYLKSFSITIQRAIPLFALKLIILNSIVAIIERIININFFPIRQTFGDQFRSTALLGHPLNNALITVAFVFFVLAINMKHLRKLAYLFILILALFCYGARGSLLASIAGIICLYIIPVFMSNKSYFYKTNKAITLSIIAGISFSFSYILLFTQFGERFRETSKDDQGSAQARVETLNMINVDNLSNYYWPMSLSKTTRLASNSGVEIIENFIIIWIFKFGLLLTICLVSLLIVFFIANAQLKNKNYTLVIVLLFFAASATNNSFGSNTNALLFFILLFGFQNVKYKFLF